MMFQERKHSLAQSSVSQWIRSPRGAVQSLSMEIKPWETWSELTVDPAVSQKLDYRPPSSLNFPIILWPISSWQSDNENHTLQITNTSKNQWSSFSRP